MPKTPIRFAIALLIYFLLVPLGCAWWSQSAPVAKSTAISCAKADVVDIIETVMAALRDPTDWHAAVKKVGTEVGEDVLDCALKTIAAILKPAPGASPSPTYIRAASYIAGVEFAP